MKNILDLLRKEIDLVDEEIIDLLAMRMKIVEKIAHYKKQTGLPALDKTRWELLLEDKITQAKKLELDTDMIKDLYNRIHKTSLIIESAILKKPRNENP